MVRRVRKAVAGAAICSMLAMGAPAGAAGGVRGPEEAQAPGGLASLSAATDFSVFRVSFGKGRPAGLSSVGMPGSRRERGRLDGMTRHEEEHGEYLLLREDEEKPEGGGSGTFPSKPYQYVLLGLMIEGMVALNAYLATLDPDIYGGFAIAMAPVAGLTCEGCDKPEAIVGSVALAGVGAYNFTLDEDRLSNSDIFWKNFVAWHVAGAALGITSLVTSHHSKTKKKKGDEEKGESSGSLRLSPVPGGLAIHYRFRR